MDKKQTFNNNKKRLLPQDSHRRGMDKKQTTTNEKTIITTRATPERYGQETNNNNKNDYYHKNHTGKSTDTEDDVGYITLQKAVCLRVTPLKRGGLEKMYIAEQKARTQGGVGRWGVFRQPIAAAATHVCQRIDIPRGYKLVGFCSPLPRTG